LHRLLKPTRLQAEPNLLAGEQSNPECVGFPETGFPLIPSYRKDRFSGSANGICLDVADGVL
jgi:hypothetical protein